MISCWDLRNVEDKPSCCGSCHDDADDYGYWMSGDEVNWNICCAVNTWLESNGVDTCEPPNAKHHFTAELSKKVAV